MQDQKPPRGVHGRAPRSTGYPLGCPLGVYKKLVLAQHVAAVLRGLRDTLPVYVPDQGVAQARGNPISGGGGDKPDDMHSWPWWSGDEQGPLELFYPGLGDLLFSSRVFSFSRYF